MTNEKRDDWLYHAGIEELRGHVLDLEDQIENLHELLGEEMQRRRELEQELAKRGHVGAPPGLDSEQYSVGQ